MGVHILADIMKELAIITSINNNIERGQNVR